MTESMPASTSTETPDWCYWIDEAQVPDPERGYIPSVVRRGEPGHSPLTGNGPYAQPYNWGKTLAEAEATAEKANEEIGLSAEDVLAIRMSSMRASGL